MSSTSADLFPPDPLSPFTDWGLDFDLLKEITDCLDQDSTNPLQDSTFIDPIAQFQDPRLLLLPSSPPVQVLGGDFPSDESQSANSSASLYKDMQRSFSSISFGGIVNPPTALSSPEICGQMMRRVCSTGDLVEESSSSSSSHFRGGPGRYTAEERRERIHRYRAKRNQRNFTKTIKYACRKTLADNRPRVRGRFARHEEPSSSSDQMIPKTATFYRYDEEDDLWIDNLGDNQGNVGGGHASF